MRKLFLALFSAVFLFIILHSLFLSPVYAEGEFSSSYNVKYEVDVAGDTVVTEDIVLTNLTDRFYASSFSLVIGASQISDVIATDNKGNLPVTVNSEGNKTNIKVQFSQQIAGKGKQYPWKLKFKSKDFAQAMGKVWQVSVPRITATENLDQFNLTLSVPVSFGDPTTILPEPKTQSEAGGKLLFTFTKEQLTDTGILANFGTNQTFDYKLTYHVSNPGVLPTIAKLPLPPNTAYQEVIMNSISPKPENVGVDRDGNYIGYFKVDPKQELNINVSGLAKLYINPRYKYTTISKDEQTLYTSSQKYWEVDSPLVKTKVAEIFKDGVPNTNREKARLISRFVSKHLQYDHDRLKNKDFDRLGGLTALANPNKALCSEYTDLFITLARAVGIPARELTGYAYTNNQELRPSSLDNSVLHAWPEYYDPEVGWVMIDPTWESTTGGVDYFSKFDLNHFVLAVRGVSSESPTPADQVDVKFSLGDFSPESKIFMSLTTSDEMFAGFPSQMALKIENQGNYVYNPSTLELSAAKIKISPEEKTLGPRTNIYQLPAIPAAGVLEYDFDLTTDFLWQSFDDIVQAEIGGQSISKKIIVRPFFEYRYFSIGVVVLVVGIVIIYLGILFAHYKMKKEVKAKVEETPEVLSEESGQPAVKKVKSKTK